MNIIIEGVDCTGKNTLAKELAKELKMQYFDSDYSKDTLYKAINSGSNEHDFYAGMLYTEMQMFKSLDNIIKARFFNSSYVYRTGNLIPGYLLDMHKVYKEKINLVIFMEFSYYNYVEFIKKSNRYGREHIYDKQSYISLMDSFKESFMFNMNSLNQGPIVYSLFEHSVDELSKLKSHIKQIIKGERSAEIRKGLDVYGNCKNNK